MFSPDRRIACGVPHQPLLPRYRLDALAVVVPVPGRC